MKRQRVYRWATATLVTLVGLLLILGLTLDRILPYFINLDEIKNKIELSIQESTGIRAEIQTLSIRPTLLHGVQVEFKNNILFDPEDIKVVRSGEIQVNLRYMPLLRNKTSISRIAFNNIRVYIGERSFLFRLKRPNVPSREVLVNDAEIAFNNYDIIVDRYFDGYNKYHLNGKYLTIRHVQSNKPLELSGMGTGYFGVQDPDQRIGEFRLSGRADSDLLKKARLDWRDLQRVNIQLSNVNLKTLGSILQSYHIPIEAKGQVGYLAFILQGLKSPKIFSISGATTTPVNVKFDRYNFRFEPGKLDFQTQLQLNPQLTVASLEKLSLRLASKDFNLSSNGRVTLKQTLQQSLFDLTTKTSWIPTSALEIVPNLTPFHRTLLTKSSGRFATEFTMKGLLSKPQVNGSLWLRNVAIRSVKNSQLLAKDVDAHFKLSPDRYEVAYLKGKLPSKPFYLQGVYNPKTRTFSKGKLIAASVKLKHLRALAQHVNPAIDIFQKLGLSGSMTADVQFSGPLKHPDINGKAIVGDLQVVSVPNKAVLAKNLYSRMTLKGQTIYFNETRGQIGTSPVTMTGWLKREPFTLNLNIQAPQLDLRQARQALYEVSVAVGHPWKLLEMYSVAGQAKGHILLYGPAKLPMMQGVADVTNGSFVYHRYKVEGSQVNGRLYFNRHTIAFKDLTGRVDNIPVIATGKVYDQYRMVDLLLQSRGTNLAQAEAFLNKVAPELVEPVNLSGTADINLVIRGLLGEPLITGDFLARGAKAIYFPNAMTFENIVGRVILQPQTVLLQNVTAIISQIPITVNGQTDRTVTQYNISVKSNDVPLSRLQQFLTHHAPEIATQLQQAGIRSGTADLDLVLAPRFEPGMGGIVRLENVAASPNQLGGQPIAISSLVYNLETGQLQFPQNGLQIGDLRFTVSGNALASGYNLHLLSQRIPVSFLRDQRDFVERMIKMPLPTLFNTTGEFSIDARVTQAAQDVALRFFDAGASMANLKYPVYNMNGLVNVSTGRQFKASSDSLSFKYANSPIRMAFDINSLKDVYVEASGTLAPLLINDFLISNGSNLVAYVAMPFDMNLSGQVGEFSGKGVGNNLNMFINFNIAQLLQNPNLEKPEEAGDASLSEATLSSVIQLVGDTLKVEQTHFHMGENSGLTVQGSVENLFTPLRRRAELDIKTEPVLNLTEWAKQFTDNVADELAGLIKADLKLITRGDRAGARGVVSFENVKAAGLELEDLDGKITFRRQNALIDIDHILVPGVDVGFTGHIRNMLTLPLAIEKFNLKGNQFIVSLFTEWTNDVIVGKIQKGLWEQFFPASGKSGNIPFEIVDGKIKLKEAIVNNLIINNITSDFRLYPNTYFELENARAESAGGGVMGHLAMNPRANNYLSAHLEIADMKANAVSQILLDVTNQIFGDLSGVIDFTTEGASNDEMLANTNGYADLKIENGRLPSITRIENLLVAANTISGGIANLNLNSLFRIAAPFRTDYFAELTGTFKMIEGMIYTDDMLSDGENLDLKFDGSVRMRDGYADMRIRGTMDREIGGVLGPLGNLSIGRIIGLLPPLRKILNRIPGLGFVPGFGGPTDADGLTFEVKLEGPPVDPGSIKDFKWVRSD